LSGHPRAGRGNAEARHLEDGFAIEFTRLLRGDFLEENVTGD